MKENYSAWDVDWAKYGNLQDNHARLLHLVRYGILAPSSHNSQPWKFKLSGSSITVSPENSRRLPVSDINDRQLFISLGCAAENILVAADAYGLEPKIACTSDGAEITFPGLIPKNNPAHDHLIHTITRRSTNRRPYTGPVSDSFITLVRRLSVWFDDLPPKSDIQGFVTVETEKKNTIADALLSGLIEAMENPAFRRELSGYVIPNISSQKTGMPGSGLGIPTPPSFIVPKILPYFNVNRLSRKQDEKLLKEQTPAFGIIATGQDNPEAWMKAGQAYQSIALLAQQNGLKTAVMAAAIQIGEHYKVLQKTLNTSLRPQVFFRLGKCDTLTPHSPRIPAEELIEK